MTFLDTYLSHFSSTASMKSSFSRSQVSQQSRLYSRSNNIRTNDSINDWLSKIDESITLKANKQLGNISCNEDEGTDSSVDDANYSQARSLLREWTNDSCLINHSPPASPPPLHHDNRGCYGNSQDYRGCYGDSNDYRDYDATPSIPVTRSSTTIDHHHHLHRSQPLTPADVNSQWTSMLSTSPDDYNDTVSDIMKTMANSVGISFAPVVDETSVKTEISTADVDIDREVTGVLDKLAAKTVVKRSFLKDVSDAKTKSPVDPRVSMNARRLQVQANRLEREETRQKKLKALQDKKDTQLRAKEILIKEEKEKRLQIQREEDDIKKEMIKIRKHMSEQKLVQEKQNLRTMKNVKKLQEQLKQEEVITQKIENDNYEQEMVIQRKEEKIVIQKKLKLAKFLRKKKMKALRKAFDGWSKVMRERQISCLKAKAKADYITLNKHWNAWKKVIAERRYKMSEELIKDQLLLQFRQEQKAKDHYETRLKKNHVARWLEFLAMSHQQASIADQRQRTQHKMKQFLEAVTSTPPPQTSARQLAVAKDDKAASTTIVKGDGNRRGRLASGQRSAIASRGTQPIQDHDIEELESYYRNINTDTILRKTEVLPKKNSFFNSTQIKEDKMKANQQISDQEKLINRQKIQLLHQQKTIMNLERQKSDRGTSISDQNKNHEEIKLDLPEKLTTPSLKHNSFLQEMSDRADKRELLKKQREQRKLLVEQDKLMAIELFEKEKAEKERIEKLEKIKLIKERKALEKQKQQEKEKAVEKMKCAMVVAKSHYERANCLYRGMTPWIVFMQRRREQMRMAEKLHNLNVLRFHFKQWRNNMLIEKDHYQILSDKLFKKITLRSYFKRWLRYGEYHVIEENRAIRHYKRVAVEKHFKCFLDYTTQMKITRWHYERRAKQFNQCRMLKSAFKLLKEYPKVKIEIREKEKRMQEMRAKVASILPDFNYTPTDDT